MTLRGAAFFYEQVALADCEYHMMWPRERHFFIYVKFSHRNILQENPPGHHGFFCGHFHPGT